MKKQKELNGAPLIGKDEEFKRMDVHFGSDKSAFNKRKIK